MADKIRERSDSREARINLHRWIRRVEQQRDEAQQAFRQYRAHLLMDSNIRYGPYMQRIDAEFEQRFPWLKETDGG